eukprot:2581312-Amphidinium_carterae.1
MACVPSWEDPLTRVNFLSTSHALRQRWRLVCPRSTSYLKQQNDTKAGAHCSGTKVPTKDVRIKKEKTLVEKTLE